VHFGDAAPNVIAEQHIQSTYDPIASSQLTASIYMHLTNGSRMYGYRFSVRYNDELLDFVLRQQFRPGPFEPDVSVEHEYDPVTDTFRDPDPGPENESIKPSPIKHGMELRRFNGLILGTDTFSDDGFYKIATIKFALDPNVVLPSAEPLVLPGEFEFFPNDVDIKDAFLGVDVNDDPIVLDVQSFGGSVSNSSVPEPTSAIVLGAIGVLALGRRKRRDKVNGPL
jgi:hypothetical protein